MNVERKGGFISDFQTMSAECGRGEEGTSRGSGRMGESGWYARWGESGKLVGSTNSGGGETSRSDGLIRTLELLRVRGKCAASGFSSTTSLDGTSADGLAEVFSMDSPCVVRSPAAVVVGSTLLVGGLKLRLAFMSE